MYRIAKEKEQAGRAVAFKGGSVRDISAHAGIAEMTAWRIWKDVRREVGVIYCQCGKVAGHKGWCGFRIAKSPSRITALLGQLRDISRLNIYVPTRPRYERPEIPNERETELPLLVNQRFVCEFDSPVRGYDGESLYNFVADSAAKTPLEILLEKEEYMTGEPSDRARRITEWERWCERKSSAFTIT